ncbi:MAG: hypothetical protein ACFFER_19380 [Candidatus Thorarchaeota archaeon]
MPDRRIDGKRKIPLKVFSSFSTYFPKKLAIEVLIQSLGVWTSREKAGLKVEGQGIENCEAFSWENRNSIFILGKTDGKHHIIYYYSHGRFNRRTANRVVGRLKGQDPLWPIRTELSKWVDETRLRQHDARAYVPFALLGSLSSAMALLSVYFDFPLGTFPSLIATLATPLVYGLHRYGIAERAVDLRLLSLGIQYETILRGLPMSILLVYFVLAIPFDSLANYIGVPQLDAPIAFLSMFVVFYLLERITRYVSRKYTWPFLVNEWLRICVVEAPYDLWPGSEDKLRERLPHIANLWFMIAHYLAFWLMFSSTFATLFYRYIELGSLSILFEAILISTSLLLCIIYGRYVGAHYALEQMKGIRFVISSEGEGVVWRQFERDDTVEEG